MLCEDHKARSGKFPRTDWGKARKAERDEAKAP